MPKQRKPMKVTCGSSDCAKDLHCFRRTRDVTSRAGGACNSCGKEMVDWARVHSRSLGDLPHTFKSMRTEFVRFHYWNQALCQRAINYARRKGKKGLRQAIERRLKTSIVPEHPFHDGWQTPTGDDAPNPIFNAQHATATCCRKCLEYWHGIPQGREVTSTEVAYLVELVSRYLELRIPDLKENGVYVPPIRNGDHEPN